MSVVWQKQQSIREGREGEGVWVVILLQRYSPKYGRRNLNIKSLKTKMQILYYKKISSPYRWGGLLGWKGRNGLSPKASFGDVFVQPIIFL